MGQFFKIGLKIFLYILGTAITIALLLLIVAKLKYFSIVHPTPKNITENISPGNYGQYVNNFIGTGGFPSWVCGMNFPGATVPFGMVRLSPETITLLPKNKMLLP